MANENILTLLKATLRPEHLLGRSQGGVEVYDFANVPGMEQYVLRVENPASFKTFLATTTALTATRAFQPASPLIGGMHIGQPLMEMEDDAGVSILLKQSGRSLTHWRNSMAQRLGNTPRARNLANLSLMDGVLALNKRDGTNPFVALLDQAYRLGTEGYLPDLLAGNLLLDPGQGTLAAVDQVEVRRNEKEAPYALQLAAAQLRDRVFFVGEPLDADVEERFHTVLSSVRALVDKAEKQVKAKYAAQPEPVPPVFAQVSDTRAVALSDPPKTLLHRLNQLRQDAGLAR